MIPLLTSLFAATLSGPPPAVLLVGPTRFYQTIDAALVAAPAGAQLLVDPGTYARFTITNPVSIAGNGGTFTVQLNSGFDGITVAGTTGTVAIEDARITMDQTNSTPIVLVGCSGDVRLRNVVVDTNTDLGGTWARAAITVYACADVIFERVTVNSAQAHRGSTAVPDGLNNGLSALRVEDANLYLRECVLRGFDAPLGNRYGGDALRAITTTATAKVDATLWGGAAAQVLIGGNGGAGNGGNCVHHIGTGSCLVEGCFLHLLSPGAGTTLAGGVYATNNNGGGGGQQIPFCIDLVAFTTTAPSTIAPGTSVGITVSDPYPGGPCLLLASIGSTFTPPVPGVHGRSLLGANSFSLGFGTTPATFALTLPADPNLIGLQLTAQALVTSGSGTVVSGLSRPSFLGVR